ncbi:MAG: acyl-ACP thioesterase [Treponema sp.]|jgi:acyl-CoA thioesterase FadM|nr:acyl-ACP thioesterase [Treponema sp.]
MDIFEEPAAIRFADIDQSDTLSAAAAGDFFQEAAISHAEILGVGRDAMRRTGQVWILSRLSVFMERRPRFMEKVLVRSWPRGTNRLFALRDYDIRSPLSGDPPGPETGGPGPGGERPGQTLVRGRGAWLILDLEKRRPLRPQAAAGNLPLNEGIDALAGPKPGNEPPPALAARDFSAPSAGSRGGGGKHSSRRACYSDIDYNGHMNNARYIQWIQDMIEPGILERATQIRLDINYLAEVRQGDAIGLYMIPIDEPCFDTAGSPAVREAAFAIEGRREDPGRSTPGAEAAPVFRAELRTGQGRAGLSPV